MTTATKESLRTVKGRPQLFTSYAREMAIFNTRVKRNWVIAGIIAMAVIPFFLQRDMVALLTTVLIFAIGGIGLNVLTGYAGQVSLGQAFFMGVGAYTAAVLGGEAQGDVIGLGLDMVIWLPLAGLVPALVAFVLAPLAARVRGLYLAILTLGLVFIGEHIFKEAKPITGGAGVGRAPAEPVFLGFNLYLVANLALGFLISTVTRIQMQAMQVSFFLLLPTILLSGFMFPFSGMPLWAQTIGNILPATHFLRLTRKVMLKSATLPDVIPDIAGIVVIMIVVVTVALMRYRQTLD